MNKDNKIQKKNKYENKSLLDEVYLSESTYFDL